MGGTKRVEGWNKILWMCNGGGGVGRLPPGYGHASIQKCSWGEPQTPPPPGCVPRVSIGPPPRISAPLWRPFSPGTKIDKQKKRERGALDSAAFKLAPIQAGRAPPPRLAPMPPPCTPPPLGTPLPPPPMAGHRHTFLS